MPTIDPVRDLADAWRPYSRASTEDAPPLSFGPALTRALLPAWLPPLLDRLTEAADGWQLTAAGMNPDAALADGLAEALRLTAEWSGAVQHEGWSWFDALNVWRERRGMDPLPGDGRPAGLSDLAWDRRLRPDEHPDVETVVRGREDLLGERLHNAHEAVRAAQPLCVIAAHRVTLQSALDAIAYVAEREGIPVGDTFPAPDPETLTVAAVAAPTEAPPLTFVRFTSGGEPAWVRVDLVSAVLVDRGGTDVYLLGDSDPVEIDQDPDTAAQEMAAALVESRASVR